MSIIGTAQTLLWDGVETAGVIGVTPRDAAHGEPRAAQRAVTLDRLHRVIGTARIEAAVAAEHRPQQVLIPAQHDVVLARDGAVGANRFAELAPNAVAVDRARRHLAADDVADASAGCGSR